MPKQKVEIELEVPSDDDGTTYEATGEFREPLVGESFIGQNKLNHRWESTARQFYAGPRVILKPKAPTPRVPKVGEVWEQQGTIYLIARNSVQPQFVQAVDITGDWTVAWNRALPEDVLSRENSKFLAPDIATWALEQVRCKHCGGGVFTKCVDFGHR